MITFNIYLRVLALHPGPNHPFFSLSDTSIGTMNNFGVVIIASSQQKRFGDLFLEKWIACQYDNGQSWLWGQSLIRTPISCEQTGQGVMLDACLIDSLYISHYLMSYPRYHLHYIIQMSTNRRSYRASRTPTRLKLACCCGVLSMCLLLACTIIVACLSDHYNNVDIRG